MEQTIIQRARDVGAKLARRLADIERRLNGEKNDKAAMAASLNAALDEAMEQLRATGVWGPDNRIASNGFWEAAEPWLLRGDLQVHARSKPRGYAGDYQLLMKICSETCCAHRLGNLLDLYFQAEAAPRAVRHRTQLVAENIERLCEAGCSEPVRIVSIGSGPAMELQWAAQRLPKGERNRLFVTLLDIDQQALEYAQRELEPLVGPQRVQAIRTNLARLPTATQINTELASTNYLYCSGFFDYLSESAGCEMLNWFYQQLAPGGKLTVYNFSPSNTSRAYMEWIGNWYLTYRDVGAMQRLADGLEGPHEATVRSLSHGTLVELTVTRRE